jgi:hypothetical protein
VAAGPRFILGDRAGCAGAREFVNNAATPGGSIKLSLAEADQVVFRVRRASAFRADAGPLRSVHAARRSIDRSHGASASRSFASWSSYGGRVEVASAGPNQGCEFCVRIPQSGRSSLETHDRFARDVLALELAGRNAPARGCTPAA